MKIYPSPITKCIKSDFVETYHGFEIRRETDRPYRPDTGEFYGHARVFYVVYDGDWMVDSLKTLKEAKKYIEKLL